MTIWQNFATMALMLGVFALALVVAQSDDWRDKTLAYIVMIVYISIGAYHAYRLTKRTKPS
jgi:disulfide bond formation protein DsbB